MSHLRHHDQTLDLQGFFVCGVWACARMGYALHAKSVWRRSSSAHHSGLARDSSMDAGNLTKQASTLARGVSKRLR